LRAKKKIGRAAGWINGVTLLAVVWSVENSAPQEVAKIHHVERIGLSITLERFGITATRTNQTAPLSWKR
jgi:hypothetical protein